MLGHLSKGGLSSDLGVCLQAMIVHGDKRGTVEEKGHSESKGIVSG